MDKAKIKSIISGLSAISDNCLSMAYDISVEVKEPRDIDTSLKLVTAVNCANQAIGILYKILDDIEGNDG